MRIQHVDDAILIERAKAGSDAAFRDLYAAYAEAIYRIAYAITRETTDAEEVVQDTFLTAWRKLGSVTLVSESALPWLATICRFQAANKMRTQIRHRTHTGGTVHDAPGLQNSVDDAVLTRDLARRISAEVAALSTLDREIFILCVSEELSYAHAAEKLNVSHGVVRNRLSRIRHVLRGAVKEHQS